MAPPWGFKRTVSTSYNCVVQASGVFANVDGMAGPNDFSAMGDVRFAVGHARWLTTAP